MSNLLPNTLTSLPDANFSELEQRILAATKWRFPDKAAAAFAAAYGGNVSTKDLKMQWMPWQPKKTSAKELADHPHLSVEEWRWAVAFREVLGVGEQFYEKADQGRRKQLQEDYEALARTEQKQANKARRILARRVALTLEEAAPLSQQHIKFGKHDDMVDAMYGTMTGRMSMKGPPQSIPKPLNGLKATDVWHKELATQPARTKP